MWKSNAIIPFIVLSLLCFNITAIDCYENDSDVTYKTIRIPTYIWNKALSAQSKETDDTAEYTPVTLVVPIMIYNEENEVEVEDDIVGEAIQDDIVQEAIQDDIVQEVLPDEAIGSIGSLTTPEPSMLIPSETEPSVVVQTASRPCSCFKGQCGCCTGVLLQRWRQHGCANISFLPEEFVFDMRLTFNNDTVLRRKVSVSDPPPICFNPPRFPFMEVCATMYNIHVKNGSANVCVDLDANLGGFNVFSRKFDCFRLGRSGIRGGIKEKPIKPSGGVQATNLFGNNDDDDDDDDGGLFGDDDGDDDDDGFFGEGDDDDEPGGLFGGDGGGPLEGAGDLLDGLA